MLLFRSFLTVLLGAVSMLSMAQAATTTSTLNVTGVVEQKCLVASMTNMNFGAYETTAANNQRTATSTISVRCVAGSTGVKLSFSQGLHSAGESSCENPVRRLRSTTDVNQFMSYNLYRDAQHSSVLGCDQTNEYTYGNVFTSSQTAVSTTVYGLLPGGQDVFRGTYRDTITVNLTF